MHFNNIALVLTSIGAAVVQADLDFDSDDIPSQCTTICKPIRDLTKACDVDDDVIRDDRTEDLLEAQCVCTNNSFDVANIASLCAACVVQNAPANDRDDYFDDLDDIMRTCGFTAATSYNPSESTAAQSVTVVANRPTASDQLTTTITGGAALGSPTTTDDSGRNSRTRTTDDSNTSSTITTTDGTMTTGGGGNASGGTTTTRGSDNTSGSLNPSGTGNAAPGLAPVGGFNGLVGMYLAGLFTIGVVLVY